MAPSPGSLASAFAFLLPLAAAGAQSALPPELLNRPLRGCTLAGSGESVLGGTTWTGGNVPYVWHANVTPAMQQAMQAAMLEIQAVANVRFVVRTSETDYLLVRDSVLNSSSVGRAGGAQVVHVFNWNQRFTLVHELVHALGFWHEHQRPDRDTFVTVNWANVLAGMETGFQIVPTGNVQGSAYDFDSVMHGAGTEASSNGQPTLVVNPPNQHQQTAIGQRTHLSTGDARALRITYGSPTPPVLTSLTPDATPTWGPSAVTIDGQLLDEAVRVFLGTQQVTFTRPTPSQLRFTPPQLSAIGSYTVEVESLTGRSNGLQLRITGNDPPVLEGAPIVIRGFPIPYRVHGDNVRTAVLAASVDLLPSVVPGIVSLGIGNQFATLLTVGSVQGNTAGVATINIQVPSTVPPNVSFHLQALLFDAANPVPPLPVSNVLQVRTF